MIILGDIASPNSSTSVVITEAILTADFKENQSVLFNLEGLITDTFSSNEEKPILFNHSTILNAFNQFDTKIAALANNHTLDFPEYLNPTKEIIRKKNFKSLGAGNKQDIDIEFVVVKESGYNVCVYSNLLLFLPEKSH